MSMSKQSDAVPNLIPKDGIKCDAIIVNTKDNKRLNQCNKYRTNGIYCEFHAYFVDFTSEQLNDINRGIAPRCTKCKSPNFEQTKTCKGCKDKKNENSASRTEPSRKCGWKTEFGDCANITRGKYCHQHYYVYKYTEEQIADVSFCEGCSKYMYIEPEDGEKKLTCSKCRNGSAETRKRIKSKDIRVQCGAVECSNKAFGESKYCKVHKKHEALDKLAGSKICSNVGRGCLNVVDGSYKRCDACRKNERTMDRQRREAKKNKSEEMKKDEENRFCRKCGIESAKENFIGVNGEECDNCQSCRNKQRIQDRKRTRDYKEMYRKYPKIAESKKKWRQKNNDKAKNYYIKSRLNRIRNVGIKEYLKINAERAAQWRKENKGKLAEYNEMVKCSTRHILNRYKVSSHSRNVKWELTDEDAIQMIEGVCLYCGLQSSDEKKLGIDRMDSSEGYTPYNCVGCCTECNMMKGCIDPLTFAKMCDHILTFNDIVEGELCHDMFPNSIKKKDILYIERSASTRGKEFHLTQREFDEIMKDDCYICGKVNSYHGYESQQKEINYNGIDRFDNDIGYIADNCMSCCKTCNDMKKTMTYDGFMKHLIKIHHH